MWEKRYQGKQTGLEATASNKILLNYCSRAEKLHIPITKNN